MSRYYTLGILFLILFLNIPELRGDMQNKITFYRPQIEEQLNVAKDKAEPAYRALLNTIAAKTKIIIKDDGTVQKTISTTITENVDSSDTWTLNHKPSITADQFDAILREYNSPAAGVGSSVTAYATSKSIDSAYILYIFIHESTAGTNPEWAGMKTEGGTTHNIGNIICAGYSTCYGRFRDYPSWEEGFNAAIDLLVYYRDSLGDTTIDAAINRWAPPAENDTNGYVDGLHENVSKWRGANKGEFIATSIQAAESELTIQNLTAPIVPPNAATVVESINMYGCLADTIPNALNPSGKLQSFTIGPDNDWSFNENWRIVNPEDHWCGNIEYGGICDMASTYQMAARKLGLETIYQRHPGGLYNIDYDNTVTILSGITPEGMGTRGGQDLLIVNHQAKTAHFKAETQGNNFVVTAWYE